MRSAGCLAWLVVASVDRMSQRSKVRRHSREARRAEIDRLTTLQAGVASFPQLYALGLTRSQIRAELRAQRWRRHGSQAVAVHNGALTAHGEFWAATLNVGADAALDGVSALIAAGLTGFEEPLIHISVSKGTRYRRARGVRIHETRRRRPGDVDVDGPPQVHTPVAAIRAALWARTNREAALLLAMTVQQRLCPVGDLAIAFAVIRRHRRRTLIGDVLMDVAGGAESMGELDFATECRRRGIPAPTRQVRRRLRSGAAFLDAYWKDYGVVVEIEGAHHIRLDIALADSLRQNELTIANDRVLRIPLLALRAAPDQVFEQIERLLRRCGWTGARS
jgi:very-short-patch-repair endonuclease